MNLSRIDAVIERRLLVNYRADPGAVARLLPEPLRPQLVRGSAVVGVCFVRLGHVRPTGWPRAAGLRSESAAHRVAVEWDEAGGVTGGVLVVRRDTASLASALAGGRLYPGVHHPAAFRVEEARGSLRLGFTSRDGELDVDVETEPAHALGGTLFDGIDEASQFFRQGFLGWSPGRGGCLEGVRLHTDHWAVEPVSVTSARSSFLDDRTRFPAGSLELDCGLVMRDVPVQWRRHTGPAPARSNSAA